MELKGYSETSRQALIPMIRDFFNAHREMLNSRQEFYIDEEEAENTLNNWLEDSQVYLVMKHTKTIGFVRIRYGGTQAAWLEDLFIDKPYRGKGYGNEVMALIDTMMKENNILSMFVDVIPRNPAAIALYLKCGFNHLNMIQLRKNYDSRLDKTEKVNILGFELIKY